jgi:hypothetical protein
MMGCTPKTGRNGDYIVVDMDDIIPDTQLDQRKEKSRPSASNSPATADNDLPVTRKQAARARDLTSATPPGVGVPENDDYDKLLSLKQAQECQIQLLQTSIWRLKFQLIRNAIFGTQIDP